MGRVVTTHSTYIEGLIPCLKRLAKHDGISTVTPGEIKRVKGHCESLRLKISTTTKQGYKLIARKGSSLQEVFVITKLEYDFLSRKIDESIQ